MERMWESREQQQGGKKGEFLHDGGVGLVFSAPGHSTPLSPGGGGDFELCKVLVKLCGIAVQLQI